MTAALGRRAQTDERIEDDHGPDTTAHPTRRPAQRCGAVEHRPRIRDDAGPSSRARHRALVVGAALMAAVVPMTTAEAAAPSNSGLEAVRLDPDAAAPGGTTTVHGYVSNAGPEKTASTFTVEITLPEGVTAEGPFFPESCTESENGHRVRCTFPAGLAVLRSATAQIPVKLAPTVPIGNPEGGSVAVTSDDDRNSANNRQPFVIQVLETARSGRRRICSRKHFPVEVQTSPDV
ncbi:hypothetical protein [Streptomyces sp. NPDC059761]|uniref:hypothetical protein n=1 Tax=Streptomyces sp. NPDC059761 TaxID=3346937 RepID=UPI00365F9D3D